MTTPAPACSRRMYVLWGVALGVLLLVGLFSWLVAAPVLRIRGIVEKYPEPVRMPPGRGRWSSETRKREMEENLRWSAEGIIALGGPSKAAARLDLYLRLPQSLAPGKPRAVKLLARCGRDAEFVISAWGTPNGDPVYLCDIAAGSPTAAINNVVRTLTRCLEDDEEEIRMEAAESLAWIGPPAAAAAAPRMVELLRHEDGNMGEHVRDWLERIADARAGPALMPLLDDEDAGVRDLAMRALYAINAKLIIETLSAAENDGNENVRKAVQAVHGEWGDVKNYDLFIAHLREKSKEFPVETLLAALPPAAAEHVYAALKHDDPEVRVWAARTLGEIGGPLAAEPLQNALNDKDAAVREAVGEALRKIKGEEKQ